MPTEIYFKQLLDSNYDEDKQGLAMRRLRKEQISLFKASALDDRKRVLWLLQIGEDVNSKNEVHKNFI